ncbi:MAG: alpha-L-fucosidase [Marinilabiliales bacterium]|nr:MAG: alpha-L-fucosidase [Marinilabiliales bacterium]
MKIKSLIILLIVSLFLTPKFNYCQIDTDTTKFQWFADAKLGIFIHWGIYAVNGIDESWSFYNGYISYEDYMKQLSGFNAENYKPKQWAKLIKNSGAKYAVITSKHHDGVALWDSKFSDLNVIKKTPAHRDLINPFIKALRKEGLKTGIYFSLLDWSNDNYPNFTREEKRYENDSVKWNKFVKFNMGQITEVMDNYNPDLMWFDGDWEQSAEKWKAPEIRELLHQKNNNIIINSRLQGYGDYATPEQGLPIHKPKDKLWELCMTMNDSWGYQQNDKNYKTPYEVIRIFADVISMGGNLLLDIGPRADGSIPEEQENILMEIGNWNKKHNKAIFGTKAGIPREYYSGPSTISANGKILYIFVEGNPKGPIILKGIKNKIENIWVVGKGTKLNYDIKMKAWWSSVPGIIFIDLPQELTDKYLSVIAVQLEGNKIQLHEFSSN